MIDGAIGQREGYGLLEQLANEASLHDIPVLVLSTMSEVLEEAQDVRYSADRYLEKPFEVDDLLAVVAELLQALAVDR